MQFSQELDSMRRTFDESEKQMGLQNPKLNMTENVLPGKNQWMLTLSYPLCNLFMI